MRLARMRARKETMGLISWVRKREREGDVLIVSRGALERCTRLSVGSALHSRWVSTMVSRWISSIVRLEGRAGQLRQASKPLWKPTCQFLVTLKQRLVPILP